MDSDLYQNTLDVLPQKDRLKITKQIRQRQVENYIKFTKADSVEVQPRTQNKKKCSVNFDPNYCVQEAIESCDDLQVLKLIKGGFDPNFTTGNGISLLHKCCLEGNVIVAEILISMGADVNVQDNDWWTPLHVSCHRDNPELIQLLLNNGSDASVLDVDGNFPIDHAPAKSESYYIVCNHLTEQGYQSSVLTELRASAGVLVKFEIEGFINHNVDVSKPLFDGITWLHIVCANGYRKALGLLLQHAADVNAVDFNGLTPLHVAAKFNQKQVVEVLLKNDARTDILDVHGFRPMDVAASEEIQRIILNDHRKRHQSSVSSEQFEDEEEDEVFVSKVVRPPELPLSKAEKLMEAQIRFQYMEDGKTSKDRCEDKHDDEDCEYVNTILQVQPSKEANLPSTGPSDDLVNFGVISDKLILDTLSERYKFNKIYTNIGDMLIAVNPLQVLPHYSKEICHTYHNECKLRRLPPHIYASGEQSLREMNTARTSQCCVIGGESGSGKTESCKLIVQHLIEVSNCIDSQLSHKINQINPLLEAFGNAQTVLNDNSSRYAKFLELKYCSEGRTLLGASLSEYLLEKCRVVKQGEEELNFHIFYWMLAGLTPEECRSSFIDKKQHYRYLGNDLAKMAKHMTLDNKQKFWEVKQCLKFIGFTQDDVMSVISILAAILHLGNITFGKNEDDYAIFTNEEPLKKASILLHIPFEDLYSALIQDVIITAGEQTTIYLTEIQAVDSCDALAKTLYSRLFSWIVNGINQMVQPQEASCDDKLSISILDLFGFENLQQNSFEQMCINVANEQLQLYFNEHVFKNEEEDCVLEGIPRLNLTLPWNDQAISLFMERGCGILALLDEECSFPKSTDKSLAHKLHQGPGQKYKTIYKTPRDGGTKFTAVHYAGAITYSVAGILEKNRDKLRPYLSTTMRSSTNLLFRDLFNTRLSKTGSLTTSVRQKSIKHKSKLLSGLFNAKKVHRGRVGRGEKPFTKKQPATMAYHFRNSLKDLMNKVSCCKSHFIRCIKPNTEKKPDLFVAEYVQNQLKYTGVLETVQIRKNGYSMRIRFIDFLVRYKCLHAVQSFPFSKNKNREIVWCKEILGRWKIVGYKMGKTKIFLHLTDSERLDTAEKYFLRMIWKCQAMIRGYYVRKKLIIRHSKRERNMSHIEVLGSLINTNQDRIYQYQVELNEQDILRFSNSQQNEEDTTLNYLDNILDQEPLYVNIPTKEKNNNERPESELISDISCVDTLYEMFESSSELSTCNLPSETTYQEVTAHYEVPSDKVTDSMNSQPGYLPSHHSGHHPSQHPGYSPSTCEIVDQNARNYPPSPKEMYSSNLYEDMRGHNNNRSLEKIPPVLPHRSPETRLSTSTGTSSRGSSISEPDINQGLYQDSHYSTPSPPISPAKKHPHHHPSNQQYGNQPFSYVPNAAVLHQHERQTHSEYIQQDYCNGAMDNTDNVYASYIPNDDHIQQSYHGQRPTNQKHMIIGNSVKKMSSPVLSHKKYPFQNGPNGTSGSPKLRRASEGQTEVYQGQKPKGKNVGSPKLPLKFHQKSVSVDGQSSVPPPPNFPAPPPPLHVQDRYLAGANSSRCPSPPLPPPPPEYQSGSVVKPPCSAPLPPPVSTIPGRQPRPQEVVDQRPPRSSSHSRSNSGVESAAIIQELGTIKLKSRNHSSGSNGSTCTSNSNSASQNNDNNELGRIQLKKTKTERIGDIYQPVDAKPSPAPTTSSLTAGIIPICDIDDFPLPPLPEELLTATPTVIPPAPQSPIVKQAPSPPKSPLVKHSPPAPILPKSQINSVPSQTVSTKSSIVTQIPTTPISPTVTPLNGHSKPKETINARMDFEIPADIDLSQCPGLVPTPPHCPIWKKEMIDKKNKDRVEEYVRDILRDREEQEKWKNVPEWKRKVLKQKSDEARTKEKSVKEGGAPLPPPDQKTTQSELLHAGQTRYDDDFVPAAMNIDPEEFENMPPWKQELLTKRKNIPVTFNNEFNPDEPDKSPHESYDLDVKMAS